MNQHNLPSDIVGLAKVMPPAARIHVELRGAAAGFAA
jgi:hypothetical protein